MDSTVAWHTITAAFSGWYDVKMIIERSGAVSTDALHVIAGVVIQLLVAMITRKPLSSWLPWLAVLAFLVFNEAVDLWMEQWPSLAMQVGEAVKDLWLTMLLPTILMLAFRFFPRLRQPSRS